MTRYFVGGVLLACSAAAFAQTRPATQPATQPVPPATPITLHLADESPEDAFAKFGGQTKLQFQGNTSGFWQRRTNDDRRVNASFEGVPFWEAFTHLAADALVTPYGWDDGHVDLGHDDGAWAGRPAQVFGPLRVSIAFADVHRAILIAHRPQRVKSTSITLAIEAEPGCAALFVSDIKFPIVEDQKGRPIDGEMPTRPQFWNFIRGHAMFELELKTVPDDVGAVGKLQANIVTAIAQTQTLEIPDIAMANGLHRQIGDTNLTISFRKNASGYTVDAQAEPKTMDDSWALLGRALASSEMRLVDGAGVPYRRGGAGSTTQPTRITRSVSFESNMLGVSKAPGPPQKLIWAVPVSVSLIPITAEFKDLQLP